MKAPGIPLCNASDIGEKQSRVFIIPTVGPKQTQEQEIFVFRWEGQFFAYINKCPHADLPLNFQPNMFFDLDKKFIQCSNHMALFEPDTGKCIAGPCTGLQLMKIDMESTNGKLIAKQSSIPDREPIIPN